jgi:hypothetical protein
MPWTMIKKICFVLGMIRIFTAVVRLVPNVSFFSEKSNKNACVETCRKGTLKNFKRTAGIKERKSKKFADHEEFEAFH